MNGRHDFHVRQVGSGRYVARCPACGNDNATFKETRQGHAYVHCSGCRCQFLSFSDEADRYILGMEE